MSATTDSELLMYEIVDGRTCRLEWRGAELWLVVDDRECTVDPCRLFQLLREHTRRPESAVTA